MPPRTPSRRGMSCPLMMEMMQMATTEAAWMKMIRRRRSKVVMSRKVSAQATNTFEISRVRETAPPFQIGERKPLTYSKPISASRYLPSLGKSLKVRLVRPRLENNPHIARIAVSLASGTYLRPGIQSAGRAQYTKKKAASQKKAPLVASTTGGIFRRPRMSVSTTVPLSPIATNPLFSLCRARRDCAHLPILSFHCRPQDFLEALADRRPVAPRSCFRGCPLVAPSKFAVAEQHDDCLRERAGIVGQHDVTAMMNIQSFGADVCRNDRFRRRHGFVDLQTSSAADPQGYDHHCRLAQVVHHRGYASCNFNRL